MCFSSKKVQVAHLKVLKIQIQIVNWTRIYSELLMMPGHHSGNLYMYHAAQWKSNIHVWYLTEHCFE